MFDEDVLQFFKKLANPETHTNLRRSLLTFVRGKEQVQLQDDEIKPDDFIWAEAAKYEIGWDNIMI